jgi:uncharacterized SAM-binding protein YcdF (DUF218 family)
MNHPLSAADAILVLCSHDLIVAERGAQLFLVGLAPWLIFSGGFGAITKQLWSEPEADKFAEIAMRWGVPKDRILIENQSTNTGENIRFTKQLLAGRGFTPEKLIVVQKPYMERRAYATFRVSWPEVEVLVTSPQLAFEEYLERRVDESITREQIISIMVGDLQRIKVYPDKGFQIPQPIPDDVWSAYENLIKAGYDRHLITE